MKPRAILILGTVAIALVSVAAAVGLGVAGAATPAAGGPSLDPEVVRWAFASAAIASALAAISAGYAVAQIGSAAVGALTEKPDLFGRLLIMVGLAEGIAIYGLIVAVLIFNRIG